MTPREPFSRREEPKVLPRDRVIKGINSARVRPTKASNRHSGKAFGAKENAVSMDRFFEYSLFISGRVLDFNFKLFGFNALHGLVRIAIFS